MANSNVSTREAYLPFVFARTGIFGQVPGFPPRQISRTVISLLGTQKVVYFSGFGLEEQDRDVFMCLFALSRQRPVGEAISISLYRLQQMVKAVLGIYQINNFEHWLKASLLRLSHCKISLGENLPDETVLKIEQRRDVLECQFNPVLKELLIDSITIDLTTRRQIPSRLAKTLHVFLSSDPSKVVCVPFDWVTTALGHELSRCELKDQLSYACTVLKHQGIIESFEWVQRCQNQGVLKLIRHQIVEEYKPVARGMNAEKKPKIRGTIIFNVSGANAFFPSSTTQFGFDALAKMSLGDDLLQIRGELFAPMIPHNSWLLLSEKEQIKDNDLVLVTTKTSYYLGFVVLKQSPNLLLTFPGRSDILILSNTVQKIEKIRGIFYE